MATGGPSDVTLGTTNTIGRYFALVSVVPSTLLVVFVFALASSGAWKHSPRWSEVARSFDDLGLAGVAVLTVVSIAFALILHPLQFAIVQLFEGYWGTSALAQRIRVRRILHHRRRKLELAQDTGAANDELPSPEPGQEEDDHRPHSGEEYDSAARERLRFDVARRVRLVSQRDEAQRLLGAYPDLPDHVLPTRLGNVLRRYEMRAGRPYDLQILMVASQIGLVAPETHLRYLNDQRTQLDLAVRVSFTSSIAFVVVVVFLWRHGLWLLVAAVPYTSAYLAYLGAVTAAHHYGSALSAVADLNRFTLYERLHLQLPAHSLEERESNGRLMETLETGEPVYMMYRHPPSGAAGSTTGD
jgi:hypothetical protein